jgi:predicted lactoylglutathione lyase
MICSLSHFSQSNAACSIVDSVKVILISTADYTQMSEPQMEQITQIAQMEGM